MCEEPRDREFDPDAFLRRAYEGAEEEMAEQREIDEDEKEREAWEDDGGAA